ncbi:hypothetical protein DACRYDRAFT_104360 [Dacryopinax primogenitus]|uniref:Phytanoyl-CoA dioxygenase n=1 Tax=Dacryopinax primogenitus (strain DJM 731) TaxID=1858805 RepID=M5G6I9_DACPD|nr:uncharacterized protein DACRYDRAFT_104360 [Dacryopinax primogenitus]EJU05871.1 hypothetical protein DACRYDRAFT_104360 [Dacryopinax primogenitus]
MPVEYKFLTQEQRDHFLEHGWLKIPNAIQKKYVDDFMSNYWIRMDYDEHDPSTWKEEYVKLPRHRDIPVSEFCPDAYKAICDIVGGEERLDPVRNSMHGDQFIVNNGSEYWEKNEYPPQTAKGWHTDNDWYRQFLDSGEIALTIIHLFTDIEPRGGGTYICEDGMKGVCKFFLKHREGLDPPFPPETYAHIKDCKVFTEMTGKAGDTFITHVYLPHAASQNHIRKPRVISNPHVSLSSPFDFSRPAADLSLVEQVVLRALGRPLSPEEYLPTAPRRSYYPRNYTYKAARIEEELERLTAAAEKQGKGKESVDSVYLRGGEELEAFNLRQGLDKPHGPNKFPEGTRNHIFMESKRAVDNPVEPM